MAAPFNSDDLMKRSLFGAIFGFKKNSNNNPRSRASSVDQPDQPGPSWTAAPIHHVATPAPIPVEPVPSATDALSASHADAGGYYLPYNHVIPGTGQPPPLPVLSSQCPYARNVSYSSLAHQTHAPHPHPPPAPYAPYAGGYASAAPPPYSPYAPPSHASHADYQKTKADIYREIVNECEEFERSTTTTPLVESSPTTPTVHSPQSNQWCGPQHPPIHEITANFSMIDLPAGNGHYHTLDQQHVANIVQQQIDVKPILGDQNAMEALVRLVVQAVKETGAVGNVNTQSPEEILKRKRQMNNEAAARYRKRQREEKEKQHVELEVLEQRNLDLKKKVEDMEKEVKLFKKYMMIEMGGQTAPKEEEEVDGCAHDNHISI